MHVTAIAASSDCVVEPVVVTLAVDEATLAESDVPI
jgi:hypothetical protein